MFGQGILRTVRLAIVATPPLLLVSVVTLGLAVRPHPVPAERAPQRSAHDYRFDVVIEGDRPRLTCEHAHSLILRGTVSHLYDGETRSDRSHLRIAGPVLYTDLTTDPKGFFFERVPVEGDVCELLQQTAHYSFSDGSMRVSYSIELAR